MAEIWQYVQVAEQTFWGTNVYHVWFYIAILFIILLEKSPEVKRVIGLYPVFFILALYSPIAYWLIQRYTSGIWQYFARLYSMIPLPLTLGLGTVLLIDYVCSKTRISAGIQAGIESRSRQAGNAGPVIKLVLASGCCVLMIFGGTNVYSQDWMKPAQNISKVPNEALWICQELHKNESVTIAVPDSLSSYIRQMDASFITPYGRYLNSLGAALSQEHPDPAYVMEEAGKEGCDYIVVYAKDGNREAFEEQGWTPYAISEAYLIFRVENVPRIKSTYDESHRVSKSTFLDASQNPASTEQEYTSICYEYDSYGNRITEKYLDEKDNPLQLSVGYAAVHREYASRRSSLMSCLYYTDLQEKKICFGGRYETGYEYDNNKRLTRESYYDENGNPMNRTDLDYASKIIEYDKAGRVISEHYYDTEGKSKICELGYASYARVLSENGDTLGERYFNPEGKKIGEVSDNRHITRENIFNFFHTTEGIEIQGNTIKMSTSVYNNRFNSIRFQLLDSKGNYLLDFARSSALGTFTGRYTHELPDGLYMLRLKGNTNLKDESVYSLVYLTKGDSLVCQYDLLELADNYIAVKDASVAIQ